MSSRPRRSAAQRATVAITDMADRDNERVMPSRSRRSGDGRGIASVSRGPPSSPASSPAESNQHIHLTVKLPSSKLRQATTGTRSSSGGRREHFVGGEILTGRRNRGGKKSYVVESESDDEEEEEEEEVEEDEIEVGNVTVGVDDDEDDEDGEGEDDNEDPEDLGEEDADGDEIDDDDAMDVDADGDDDDLADEDADGDVDMDSTPLPPPTIKVSRPSKSGPSGGRGKGAQPAKAISSKAQAKAALNDDDDDEELSELDSDADEDMNETVEVAGGEDGEEEEEEEDVDADGEEIEVVDEDAEGEEELDSDDETPGSRAETPDLSRMTARQRAKHGEVSQEYMKLSDEVQVKKVFTAEELSMRRAEMARRRRNLSDKRNEEVKMETINKLLKKQAPKTNRRTALAGDETPDGDYPRANPTFVRWVSTKEGNTISVPGEMLAGPSGRLFAGRGLSSGKMVEEVS